jgi:adenylylsulfate kinase-like enzyme
VGRSAIEFASSGVVREGSGFSIDHTSAVISGGADPSPRLVVVLAGPIASGKSTLATGSARAFERRGFDAATIDLDLIYEMLQHTGAPKTDAGIWSRARRMAGALTDAFLDDGINAVIAEGDYLDESARAEFASMLRTDVPCRFVTLTVELGTALARVAQDPTRRISRDRSFLTRHYVELAEVLRRRPADDLCLDTGDLTVEQAAEMVVEWSLTAISARRGIDQRAD